VDRVLDVPSALALMVRLLCETAAHGSGSSLDRTGQLLLALAALFMIAGLPTYLLASKRCERCRERRGGLRWSATTAVTRSSRGSICSALGAESDEPRRR